MKFSRACIAFGLLTLVLAIVGVVLVPKTCGDDRGLGPVLALELSVNAGEVSALVRTPECAAALRENTFGDMLAFIPAFTAFLVCGALMLRRPGALVLFLLGAACDYAEDAVMLRLLALPFATREWLIALFLSARLKFFGLSLGVMALGWAAVRTRRVLGGMMLIGGGVGIVGLAIDLRLLMPGTLVAWVGLLVLAFRPSPHPDPLPVQGEGARPPR